MEDNRTSKWFTFTDTYGAKFAIHVYTILGTDRLVIDVYEPHRGHSTMTSIPDELASEFPGVRFLGDITTRPLPAELDALPARTEERANAVTAYFAQNRSQAESL